MSEKEIHDFEVIHTPGRATASVLQNAGVAIAVIAMLAACSGGGASTKKTGDGTPPLPDAKTTKNDSKDSKNGKKPKGERTISKDARKDYTAAIEFYKKQSEAGWSSDNCSSVASKFSSVSKDHPKLVEAHYMIGRSFHNCQMNKQAEKAYQAALKVDGSHALSLSNLGEIYFHQGKVDGAKKYWTRALEADGKISAARNNLAWLMIKELRQTKDRKKWKKLEADVRSQLSNSLAIDNDNVKTYVLYGLLYLEGSERNRNRLDLAKLLLGEGEKRDKEFAPLYNARGLLRMKRNNQSSALADFQKAVSLDPAFAEARMNVGNITLGFRKYTEAETQFTEVLKLRSKDYNATIGLGIAQRGLGKLDDAEASYNKAIEIDKQQAAAYFNLGVLYKDFRANSANGLEESKQAYIKARGYFRKYVSKPDATDEGKAETKDNIADCDKIIKQLDAVIKAQAEAAKAAPPAADPAPANP